MNARKISFNTAARLAILSFLLLAGCSSDATETAVATLRVNQNSTEAPLGFQCITGLGLGLKYAARAEKLAPIAGEGGCGSSHPVKLISLGPGDRMAVKPTATVNCPLTVALARWEAEVVQPSAKHFFGQPVVEINQWASYVCRTRNNRPGAKLSEHSLANALDIASFKLADGRIIAVESGWLDTGNAGQFLRTLHKYACPLFGTVLGPDADSYHKNHFHLDLGRGGICQ